MSEFIEDSRPKAADVQENKAAGDSAMEDSLTEEGQTTPSERADVSDTIRMDPVMNEDGNRKLRKPPEA